MRKYSLLVGFVFSILIFSFVQNVPFAYAAQGDVGAVVDSLEYNTTITITPEIIQVSGDTFAVVYEGAGNSGLVSKFTIDSIGAIQNSDPDDDPFGSGDIATPKVLHVVGDKYLIVYESSGQIHGAIWDMATDSETSTGAQIGTASGTDPDIVKLSDASGTFYYAIAYRSSSGSAGAIQTISVPTAGNSITPVANLGTIGDAANEIEIVKIGTGKTAVAYKDGSSIGKVKIVNISDDGTNPNVTGVPATVSLNGGTPLDTIVSNTNDIDFIHVTGDVYAVAWSDNSKVGKIQTLDITSNGLSVSSTNIGASFGSNVVDPVLIQTDEASSPFALLVAYHDSTNLDGIVKSFTITNTGTISAVIDSLTFDGPNGQSPSLVHRTGIFYAVAFQGQDGDGFVSSFNLGDDDSTAPTVGTITIDEVGSASTGDADFAKLGDSVKLTFTTNETIQTPVVTFPSLGAVTVIYANISGNIWTATATIPSGASEIAVTFTINFSDLAGNPGAQANGVGDSSSVTVDLTAPGITSMIWGGDGIVTVDNDHYGADGAGPEIEIVPNEPIVDLNTQYPTPPTLIQFNDINLNALDAGYIIFSPSSTDTRIQFDIGAGASLSDGLLTFDFIIEDLAGNTASFDETDITDFSTFTVDNSAPTLVSAIVTGDNTVVLNFNEPMLKTSLADTDFEPLDVNPGGAADVRDVSSPVGNENGRSITLTFAGTPVAAGTTAEVDIGTITNLVGIAFVASNPTAVAAGSTAVTLSNADPVVALTDDSFTTTIDATAASAPEIDLSGLESGSGVAEFPPQDIIVSTSLSTITFPGNTTVTAGLPADEIISIEVSTKTAVGISGTIGTIIEFGDPTFDILFDQPVRISLPNKAGGNAFYINSTLNTVAITLDCVTDVFVDVRDNILTGGDDGKECVIDVGSTLVIWTEHFTGFGAGGGGSTGGGGGGGDSSSPSLTTSSFSSSGVFGGILVLDPTQTVSENIFLTGEKVNFILEFYENSGTGVQHIELVTNIRDGQTIYDSDLWIEYNRGKEVIIRDSEGYWSDAGVIVESNGFDNKIEFSVVFKKEMETSDIIVRLWDIKRNSIDLEFENVIMVINDPGAVSDELDSSSELETDSELESILPEPTPGISEPTPGISEPTPGISEPTSEVEISTKPWTVSQFSILKQWGGYDVEIASDMDVLSKFGIKGEKIPPFVKQLVKWILKDEVSQEEFVNALQYLKREGMLSPSVGKQSFDVNTTTDLEEFTLEKESIDETIKFEFDDNKNSFYTQANLGDLEDKVRTLRSLANNLEIQNELASSNTEFLSLTDPNVLINQRESEWLQNPRTVTPFMQSLMDNEAALIAKIIIEHDKENLVPLISIVITNAYGVNTAITEKTHDYVQSDEQWWDNTKEGGIYIMSGSGGEKYTGLYTSEISLAINDSQGNFIGIIKAVVNFEKALLLD